MRKDRKRVLCDNFFTLKKTIKDNKKYLILSFCCCVFGLLSCFFSLSSYVESHETISVIEKIVEKHFSPFIFEIKLIFYTILPMVFCFLLSINYYLMFLIFGIEIYLSFLFFRYVIACIIHHFFYGFLSCILLCLPLFILAIVSLTLFYRKVAEIVSYPICKKKISFTPYGMFFRYTKKHIVNYLLCCSLPCFIYGNAIIILAYLISNA